jgi:hypothetical protein
MPYYADRADFEKNLAFLISNQTSVATLAGRLNTAPGAELIASQGDINIVRQDIAAIAAAVSGIAGAVGAIKGRINTATRADGSPYLLASQGDIDIILARLEALQAALPAAVWGVRVGNGNAAGVLAHIDAKPAGAALDPAAVAAAIPANIAAQVADELAKRLTNK